ncbi:MAG: hypothetical protein D3926_00765 [Desulfobacteraceae bacterium]|nr:MAG: hypothetical protein D3926_00765 [Desulfobacteraceae bacterium]
MDDLFKQMSEFSTEQKEIFKNEVLPSLKKNVAMMEKLQEQNNKEKSKKFEKQLEEIEGLDT